MYKELIKFATGKKIKANELLSNKENIKIEVDIEYDEYSMHLGDLIEDFIEHKNKPFWKRKYYHKHLTEIYKKMLNTVTITYGI